MLSYWVIIVVEKNGSYLVSLAEVWDNEGVHRITTFMCMIIKLYFCWICALS